MSNFTEEEELLIKQMIEEYKNVKFSRRILGKLGHFFFWCATVSSAFVMAYEAFWKRHL